MYIYILILQENSKGWNTLSAQVAATRCGHKPQQHIVCSGEFLWKSCLSSRILSLQQVAQNQIKLNWCDLLGRQNYVAETKISTKISQFTQSNLSLWCVAQLFAATCQPTCTHRVICCHDVLQHMLPNVFPP